MKAAKIVSMLAVLAMTSVATASDDGFKISGDFAASYFGETGMGANGGAGTGSGVGASNDTFSLDMVELNLAKSMGNSGINIGIGFGTLFTTFDSALDTVSATVKPTLNVTNTYFWHKIGDTGVTVKLGKMATGIGYETYNYMDNLNYTRSYGFMLHPVFMTGLNVAYSHSMFDVGLTVGNSIQNTDFDENGNKMIQISAGVRPIEGLAINANYMTGKDLGGTTFTAALEDKYNLFNLVGSYKWNMLNFALDYTMVKRDAVNVSAANDDVKDSSIAGYVGYSMDNWGAALRYEYANHDPSNATGVVGPGTNLGFGHLPPLVPSADAQEKVKAVTVSAYYDIEQNARVKAEVGSQKGEANSFVNHHDNKNDDNMMFYGLGVMYRF